MMNNEDSTYVLYVDHQGHPAPLSLCYHATASRRLTSSVDRPPCPSSITEVDSAYCPQCLSFHDANTAGNLGFCPKATCRLCPLCQSASSVVVDDAICFYKCGRCDWNSKICDIQTSLATPDDDNVSLEEVEKASIKLLSQWKLRIEEQNRSTEDHYSSMQKTLIEFAKDHVKVRRSSSTGHFFSKTPVTKRNEYDDLKGWSVQTLEESHHVREKKIMSSINKPVGGMKLERVSLEAGEDETLFHPSFQGLSTEIILSQGNEGNLCRSMENLLPHAIPLRPRKSRRCRAELAENRPGILLKPKLNPLEGDSSLRTGHGQWWKKDSSAIEVLPRVRVSIDASNGSRHAFLVKVSNPTLGIIRLRMTASIYSGERIWDNTTTTSPFLENILVDPLTKVSLDAKLDTVVAEEIETTDICELEPAEDSFLELGNTTSDDVPEAVSKWDAGDTLFDSKVSAEIPATLRKIGQKKSVAWFELVIAEPSTDPGVHSAIPLAMELQVGDGSWESSLVQFQVNKSGECKDFVSFDLVLIWNMLD